MKFRDRFDYYKNRQAWEEHCLSAQRTDYLSLNSDEKSFLNSINDQLRQLEDMYSPIMDAKIQELQMRISDPSDWIWDFNLSFVITFYLRDDDPDYEEDDDNILMEFTERFFRKDPLDLEWGFGATNVNHAVPSQYFTGEHHCYLYHQLYDHCYLDWRDLLRIGSLYVDIKIEEQSGMLPVIPFGQTQI
jgi:hypothetical protein